MNILGTSAKPARTTPKGTHCLAPTALTWINASPVCSEPEDRTAVAHRYWSDEVAFQKHFRKARPE